MLSAAGATRLVGVIGYPIGHSLSPRMHNAAFAARGLDWAYVPLQVEPERLEDAIEGLVALGFAGANVTVPHKTAVLAFCDEIDAFAERCGSANTLVVREGRVHASSTDGLAVVDAVGAAGAQVLVLGAGGAAQAVATALLDAGAASLTVAARRPEAAGAFAARLRTLFAGRKIAAAQTWPPEAGDATIVLNATPVVDELLVEPREGQTVVDLAYRGDGVATALVAAARGPVVDGLDVLVRQGAASFERWTGLAAPVEVMRAALAP